MLQTGQTIVLTKQFGYIKPNTPVIVEYIDGDSFGVFDPANGGRTSDSLSILDAYVQRGLLKVKQI